MESARDLAGGAEPERDATRDVPRPGRGRDQRRARRRRTEANIQRWITQFDDVGRQGRTEKTVHGLHVVTVDVAGTYVGGGMAMGGAADAKPDWALVGSIVEGVSPPYFFKMTGPAAAVRAARPAFDRLVDNLTPT